MGDMHSFKELALVFIMLMTSFELQFVSPEPTAMFDKVPAQGRYMKVYETQHKAASSGKCALMCSRGQTETPPCRAFDYHHLDGTCDFYTAGDTSIAVSNHYVFLLQIIDRFIPISIGDKQFSIYLSSVKTNYLGALNHCNELGGHLLALDSVDKYEAVKMMGTGNIKKAYVDANDMAIEGTWTMARDGSQIDNSLMFWRVGEPTNSLGQEHCVTVSLWVKTLNDVPCSTSLPFLCEKVEPAAPQN